MDSVKLHKTGENETNRYTNRYTKGEFYCQQCDYKTTSMHNIYAHKDRAHSGRIYSCSECNYATNVKNALKVHLNAIHNGNNINAKCVTNVTDTREIFPLMFEQFTRGSYFLVISALTNV